MHRATVQAAIDHGIPHSEFLSWHPHDQQEVLELGAYEAQRCGNGHHPSAVGKVGPQWRLCELCQQVEMAERTRPSYPDGSPLPGYHLSLVPIDELMEDDDDV